MTVLVSLLTVSIATGCSANAKAGTNALSGPVTVGLIAAVLVCVVVYGVAMALARMITQALAVLTRLIAGLVQLAIGAVVLGVIALAVLVVSRTT
jgi:hypothetical protein